jgi:gliding motility-associated protein GldL
MAKVYGWGASVVILGALFKINHYAGADIMLIVGLSTESIVFFFSAFEAPHVEPDWSLVYPQLAGIYHGVSADQGGVGPEESVTEQLDKMLEAAKIGPELIENLGKGLRNLSETTSKLSDVSNAALANDQYINTMKSATESASVLTDSYRKTAKAMDHNVSVSEEHLQHLQSVSKNASILSDAYSQASNSIKEEISHSKEFNSSMANATSSAKKFVEKYNESADLLSKTTETLQTSAMEGNNYNKNLQNVSKNLSALNALYELHLQSSSHQMESTNKANDAMNRLVHNLQESVTNTARYKDNIEILNKVFEQQIEGSEKQSEATIKMQETIHDFLTNLQESVDKTARFKEEVDTLAKNISALNKVYGNMLSAMNVNLK